MNVFSFSLAIFWIIVFLYPEDHHTKNRKEYLVIYGVACLHECHKLFIQDYALHQ